MVSYDLPDLPYDYSALEPFISGKTMELHHDKHHAAYVKGANTALEALEEARDRGDMAHVAQLSRDLAFNVAGHVNHTIFWRNLSPDGGGEPKGVLARALEDDFGSFDAFRGQFGSVALSIQGSGWAVLGYDRMLGRTLVLQLHDHQNGLPTGIVPLLLLDMWEHAYYPDYLNVKASYVHAFWEIVNWDDVAARFAKLRAN